MKKGHPKSRDVSNGSPPLVVPLRWQGAPSQNGASITHMAKLRRGDDTVGNPHRARIS